MNETKTGDIERFEVTGLTWLDEYGRKFRRVVEDGEVRDIRVRST